MKVVLGMDIYFSKQKEFVDVCNRYDPTFQSRYHDEQNPNWLHGETFWDQDKYNIFYLEMTDKKIDAFVKEILKNEDCLFIGEIDQNYKLIESRKPFYISSDALDCQGNLGIPYVMYRDTRYPLRQPQQPLTESPPGPELK